MRGCIQCRRRSGIVKWFNYAFAGQLFHSYGACRHCSIVWCWRRRTWKDVHAPHVFGLEIKSVSEHVIRRYVAMEER